MNELSLPKCIQQFETTDYSKVSTTALLMYYKRIASILENPIKRANPKNKLDTNLGGLINLSVIITELENRGISYDVEFDSITHTTLKIQ